MILTELIKRDRVLIDTIIRKVLNDPHRKINNQERRDWILNDEGLYLYAKGEGVKI